MSLASDWAARLALEEGKKAQVQSEAPPACQVCDLRASVTPDGGMHVDRETTLPAQDALTLGQWIVATYG